MGQASCLLVRIAKGGREAGREASFTSRCAFVLLSDGYRADLAADFEGDGCYVLAKPVQEAELDRLLRDLEPTVPIARNGAA